MRFRLAFLTTISLLASYLPAQTEANLVLITIDGLRWQELFTGADSMLITNPICVKDTALMKEKYWAPTSEDRRRQLMPFFWNDIVAKGQIFGNRLLGNKVNCSNIFWFSYPGYGEILVGKSNAAVIHSNDKIDNPDTTFLERMHHLPSYRGQVAAFGSWDVFPYIINKDRSGIPVNAGFDKSTDSKPSEMETALNVLQDQIPSPWSSVRLDAFTHHYALEYIKKYHPKIVYVAYGETDDFAHDGRYDHYLDAAHRTDQFIENLWQMLQSLPTYKDNTHFIITTDHGRGTWENGSWKSHGKTYTGSNAIWLAGWGPKIISSGEIKVPAQWWQNQIAATCLELLGQPQLIQDDMGQAIPSLIRR